MLRNIYFRILIIFFLINFLFSFSFPSNVFADTHRFWVDTSHWESVPTEWVEEGHYETVSGRRWVDTSYTVHQGHWQDYTENVWVSEGHWEYGDRVWIEDGYWEVTDYNVWVSEGYWETTHYTYWKPVNCVFETKPSPCYAYIPFFVNVYTGKVTIYRGGNIYHAKRYTIGSCLSSGFSVMPHILYTCYEKKVNGIRRTWVDTSHYEKRRRYDWIDTSHWEYNHVWVDTSHWETVSGRRWVDTSYTVNQGYWKDYTENVWVDTSHWEYEDVWVEEGFWVEAELDPEGKVLHTDKWNQNRIQYNLAMTGEEDNPRGYEIFFNGEKFVLECYTLGDFDPKSVHVDFAGTEFFADLDHVEEGRWEGFIWDESFINFHNRDCVFKFTASYEHEGETFELEDEVTVYIVRDEYWRLHRSY